MTNMTMMINYNYNKTIFILYIEKKENVTVLNPCII